MECYTRCQDNSKVKDLIVDTLFCSISAIVSMPDNTHQAFLEVILTISTPTVGNEETRLYLTRLYYLAYSVLIVLNSLPTYVDTCKILVFQIESF